ncbi:MAG: putative lipid II flippase FtsW [Gammaproteobacteria bacterium]|nr:MAG: putative lipid II flippase FtsW [Gammaproteobacteria bacterium]
MTSHAIKNTTQDLRQSGDKQLAEPIWFDKYLLMTSFALLIIGFIMVSSASIPYAAGSEKFGYNPYYFTFRHGIYMIIGMGAALVTLNIKTDQWEKASPYLLISGLVLLILVLFIGEEINHSKRWLNFGLFTVQVSEPVKIFVVAYLAGYLVRRREELHTQIKGFLRPLLVLSLVTVSLLLEPDFGASVVIVLTCLAMMFLAGAKLWQFIVLTLTVSGLLVVIANTQTYRLKRLQAFLDPWQDPYATGYQLIQSLIAFGRGEIWGLGLGNSIQKLDYLPMAHTDFVFAVLAEETGFVGVVIVLGLFSFLITRIMMVGRRAVEHGKYFAGYMTWGLGITFTIQAVINIGVTSGALPTKGLTLPLISYGGSSLIISCVVIAIILRVDYETRISRYKQEGIVPGGAK